MSTQHPIIPPPELVASLRNSAPRGIRDAGVSRECWLINEAYSAGADHQLKLDTEQINKGCQAGVDMQLDVMLAKLEELHLPSGYADRLRALCRPNPPSLKEQGLEALGPSPGKDHAVMIDHARHQAILAALEALHDDN